MASRPASPAKGLTTRRRFLIGTGVAAGLIVGFAVWPRERPLNLVARPGEAIMGGWLKIGDDGRVTVIVPQAEMGQGVYTALPQILADELGADWRTVAVEPAPLHPIYANTFMAGGIAEGMPAFLKGFTRWAATELIERYALQLTGGSTSVRAYHDNLRLAGAAARAMLCKAAAREWDVDWTECDTANGFVVHKANRIRFADIASKATEEDAPEAPPLRARRRLVGQPLPRIDIPSKTDGSARFGSDVRLPGMVYAAVRAGPIDGAELKSVDARAARARPGVIGIVEGPNWVAAVADTWWGAKTALDTVKASFGRAGRPAGPWMDAELKAALGSDDAEAFRDDGDVEEAFEGAKPVAASYSVPALAHACLEPMTATARVTADRAEVWAPTQSQTLANWAVARELGIPEEMVTIFPTLVGGGFGRKAEVDACMQAARIAREVKRPVQLIWSREEDMRQGKFRPPARAAMRATLGSDKRIAAWDATIAVPDVGASFFGRAMPSMAGDPKPNGQSIEGAVDLPYDIPNLRVRHALVELPAPFGFWRSVGHSYTAFFVESFIDELARAAGLNAVDFRLRMMASHPRHAEVLKVAAAQGSFLADDGVARGLALHESFGSIVAMVAEVEATAESGVSVKRVTAAVDCGTIINPDIVRAQIEGGIVFGLSAVLHGRTDFQGGFPQQTNFDTYALLSMAETPEIEVILMPSTEPPGGVGEIAVPPVAPAIANALFAATGVRVRDLPFAGKKVA